MDIERARFNMIEQQIRPWEVLDPRVLNLLSEIPREAFVPEEYRHLAFSDIQIPIGHGEVMMQPKVEARLVQALALRRQDRVLEVGTGSGFVTALLARLALQVISVEINPPFTAQASKRLAEQGLSNITLETGDGSAGWDRRAPYDAILLTGSVPVLPDAFLQQVAPDGRLVAIVGRLPVMEAVLHERIGDSGWRTTSLFDTALPPLRGADTRQAFVF